MDSTKPWWQSRTIWMGVLTSILPILSGLHLMPKQLDTNLISDIVTTGLGLATIYFRIAATKEVAVLSPVIEVTK